MKFKPLIETNPYLKDPSMMQKLVARSVRTSCGVEGVRYNSNAPHLVITARRAKKIYQTGK